MSGSNSTRDRLRDVRPGDRWLVVVAHPDDESFGCGSVIAHAASSGALVTVACATRGEAGESTEVVANAADLATIREHELRAAAETLGVATVDLLGYLDSGFDGEEPEGSLCGAPLAEMVEVVGDLLHRHQPDVVLILDGSDGHRDHLRIREAVRAVLPTLTAAGVVLYEHCLVNHLMRRWLDEMRRTHPDTAHHGLDPASLGRPEDEITDTVDVGHLVDVRESAIAQHRSQRSPFDGLSAPLRRAFLERDCLARVC